MPFILPSPSGRASGSLSDAQIARRRADALAFEQEAETFSTQLRETLLRLRSFSAPEHAPQANQMAREMASSALTRDAQGGLVGPILQQLWGYALSGLPGARSLLEALSESRVWRGPGRLGQPGLFALGVAIALQRQASQEIVESGLELLAARGAPLDQAMAWCVAERGETPQILGVEEAFRSLEAFSLRLAQRAGAETCRAQAHAAEPALKGPMRL